MLHRFYNFQKHTWIMNETNNIEPTKDTEIKPCFKKMFTLETKTVFSTV